MTDIVSAVARFLPPELARKISFAAGLDHARGQRAIDAAIPVILRGLADLAVTPGGGPRLAVAVAAQPTDIASAFAGNFIELTELAARGNGIQSTLLGDDVTGRMAWIVGKIAGIGAASTRTLMGLLMPVIMGALGREQQVAGLDVNGLSRLLTDQREEITAAMPAGLADLLEVDKAHQDAASLPILPRQRADESPRAAMKQYAISDVTRTISTAEWPSWELPLLVAVGLIWLYGLIWLLLLPTSPPQATKPLPTSKTVARAVQEMSGTTPAFVSKAADDWVSIDHYFNREIYNRAGERLGTIEDVLVGPDGKINAAVVAIDRHLGLGAKDIAVPFVVLHLERHSTGTRLVFDVTKDALRAAPAFDTRPATGR